MKAVVDFWSYSITETIIDRSDISSIIAAYDALRWDSLPRLVEKNIFFYMVFKVEVHFNEHFIVSMNTTLPVLITVINRSSGYDPFEVCHLEN